MVSSLNKFPFHNPVAQHSIFHYVLATLSKVSSVLLHLTPFTLLVLPLVSSLVTTIFSAECRRLLVCFFCCGFTSHTWGKWTMCHFILLKKEILTWWLRCEGQYLRHVSGCIFDPSENCPTAFCPNVTVKGHPLVFLSCPWLLSQDNGQSHESASPSISGHLSSKQREWRGEPPDLCPVWRFCHPLSFTDAQSGLSCCTVPLWLVINFM